MKAVKIGIVCCIVVFLVACSREKQFNNRLEGTWEAEQFLGVQSTKSTQTKFTFEKESGKEGYGVLFIRSGSSEYTESFTYTVDRNYLNLFSESNFYFFQIASSTKKKITLIDQSDKLTILEKE